VIQHHPLYEPVFDRKKVVARSEKIRALYREYGVTLVISGHRHRYAVNLSDRAAGSISNVSVSQKKRLLISLKTGSEISIHFALE
jgi:predicted phosphodiesterase